MLVVRRVVDARRQEHHGRVVDARGRQPSQVAQELVDVTLHRPHGITREQVRQDALHHVAVGLDVGGSRGRAQVVLEDEEIAPAVPHQVDAGDVAVDPVRDEPVQLLVESTVRRSRPSRGRKHLVIEPVELVVGIKSHEIHRYSVCAIPQPAKTINLRVGCEFRYDVSAPTVATVQVRPRSDARHQLVTETWSTQPPVPIDEYADFYGNPVKRLVMPQGELALRYDAVVAVPDEPDLDATGAPQLPADDIPGELLHFTLPSRYCLSDQLMGMAWELFGATEPGGARVQAICDWVHDNIKFQYGTSNPLTTAVDVLEQRRGVCRDLAHLAITFCRALHIPARDGF